MNKFGFLFSTLLLVGLASCSRDENTPLASEGYIQVKVTASDEMQEEITRTADSEGPEVDEFALAIKNADGETIASWDRFSDYDPEKAAVPAGKYTVSASYGDALAEGFDALSYAGSVDVEVPEGETVGASVDCTINKARVSISYTDAFKEYFSSYSASISSASGKKIDYAANEIRAAYFLSGNLDIYLSVTRPGATESVSLKVKTLTAELKHEYRLTMDVDAGSATLKIVFNDNPKNTQNVLCDISDAALNAAPPVFTANGFTAGEAIEVVEGKGVEGVLQAYINAPSGFSDCILTTKSAALKAQGWPEKIDLINATDTEKKKLTDMGLIMKGLGEKRGKIAAVEFQDVIPYLYCLADTNEVHTFTLTATNTFGKVSETPLELKVISRNNGFLMELPESVPYGSNTLSLTLTLEGDASKVKFYYWDFGAYQEFEADPIVTPVPNEANKHSVTLTYSKALTDTERSFQVKAVYATKECVGTFEITDPELTLSLKNGDADVWATKAYVQVVASAKSRTSRVVSGSTVEIQYKNGENWEKWPDQSFDNKTGLFLLTGMGEGATETSGVSYTLRAAYKRKGEAVAYSGELSITTEAKAQVGNRGFEEWYSKALYSQNVLWAKNTIYGYYIWNENSDESLKWWDTVNTKTTPNPGNAAVWNYRSYPGTIPTSDETRTASYFLRTRKDMSDLITEGHTGNAIEISTVGWGTGNTWTEVLQGTPANRTAGALYIGIYGDPINYGKQFSSRPSNVRFWYKYYSYNSESTTPYVNIFDENNEIIGTGSISITSSVYTYSNADIELTYTSNKKAHSITIVFLSTDSKNPSTMTVQGESGDFSGNLDSRHIGSILTVDDVELIYE